MTDSEIRQIISEEFTDVIKMVAEHEEALIIIKTRRENGEKANQILIDQKKVNRLLFFGISAIILSIAGAIIAILK